MMAHGPNPASCLFLPMKFYWAAALFIGLCVVCVCLCTTVAEQSGGNRGCLAHKSLKYLEKLSTPNIEHCKFITLSGSNVMMLEREGRMCLKNQDIVIDFTGTLV